MVAERIEPLREELSVMSHLDYRKVERLPTEVDAWLGEAPPALTQGRDARV